MDIPNNKITEELRNNNDYLKTSEDDSQVYDYLDRHLEKVGTNSFSLEFSKNVLQIIEIKQQRLFKTKIYSCAIFFGLLAVSLLSFLLDSEFFMIISSTFLKYKFTAIFVILVVFSIQFGGKLMTHNKDII